MKKLLDNQFSAYAKWPTWLLFIFACAATEILFFIGNFLYGLIIALLYVAGVSVTGRVPAVTPDAIFSNLYVELLSFGVVALLLFAWVKWYEKRSIVSLGFYKENWFKELALGFGVGALQFSLALFLVVTFGGAQFHGVDFSTSTLLFVVTIIPFWLLQGGTEELLTRGWLIPLLSKRIPLSFVIGTTSIIFGLMHLGNDHVSFLSILDIILSGMMMALYMLYRDNLWSVVGLHGAWNFVQGNIYGIEVSGSQAGPSLLHFTANPSAPDWLSGGQFGTEGSLLACVVEVLFMVAICYLMKKDNTLPVLLKWRKD